MARLTQIFSNNEKRWLSDDAALWRYVPLRTLFFYLNGLAFVPSIEKLRNEDPFEGKFYEKIEWFNTAFHQHYGDSTNAIDEWMLKELCSDYERNHVEINKTYPNAAAEIFRRHYLTFIRRTRFAWCWFHSYRESAAMWSVYGNQGVAVKSTIGRISAVLEKTGREFIYGQMTYVDYQSGVSTEFNPEQESDFGLLLRPFFLKRREYESEHEVRFVTSAAERKDKGGILLKDLSPNDWITEIRLWPRLTRDEERSIKKAVEHFMPGADCQKSDLFFGRDSFSDFFEGMDEEFEQSADSDWRNDGDGIPKLLKKL